jgi:AcrR family transcriptional regulator
MCNGTKHKIASTMYEMMSRKSFEKITVKNLMDVSNMNRQSFYYHFRDTRDVLMWICQERVFQPLVASDLEFSEWIIYGLELLNQDRLFYLRVVGVSQTDFAREFIATAIFPRIKSMLYPEVSQLGENQTFAVDFLSNAIMDYYLRFLSSHDPLEPDDCRKKLRFLLAEVIHINR